MWTSRYIALLTGAAHAAAHVLMLVKVASLAPITQEAPGSCAYARYPCTQREGQPLADRRRHDGMCRDRCCPAAASVTGAKRTAPTAHQPSEPRATRHACMCEQPACRAGRARTVKHGWRHGTHPVVAGREAPDAAALHLEAPHDPPGAPGLQVCLRLGVPVGAHLHAVRCRARSALEEHIRTARMTSGRACSVAGLQRASVYQTPDQALTLLVPSRCPTEQWFASACWQGA